MAFFNWLIPKKKRCFKCEKPATDIAFINGLVMNVCRRCNTVWPLETDNYNISPEEDKIRKDRGDAILYGYEITK